MRGVQLHIKNIERWVSNKSGCACGTAFIEGKMYTSANLVDLFSVAGNLDELCRLANSVNGFFAGISVRQERVLALVDRVRSIPLFYGQASDTVYISDDAYWVQEQLSVQEYEQLAVAEFSLLGYVTGRDTLSPAVKQLQAGEALEVRRTESGALLLELRRYYHYVHRSEQTGEHLFLELDQVLSRVFGRLVERADGRTILVPLSGGLDSRLIVMWLRRLGYSNVITYSYGRPGNKESQISQYIARELGFPWLFIPYSNAAWYAWFRTPERMEYRKYADGLTAIAHLQDWPAVWALKQQGLIPENSMFVPGHSADLLAGSRSKAVPWLYQAGPSGNEKTLDSVWYYHYRLSRLPRRRGSLYGAVRQRLRDILLEFEPLGGTPDGANFFEFFDWQERQAKFIVNSVRAYEFWGYEWWLPFWDAEFMRFWSKVPVTLRKGKNLYESYVLHQQRQVGLRLPEGSKFLSEIKKNIYRLKVLPAIELVEHLFRKRTSFDKHPLCLFGIMEPSAFGRYYIGPNTVSVFLMLERLGRLGG